MNQTACVFYYTDNRYDELVKCAVDSFKKFNSSEVDVYVINKDNKEEYNKSFQYYEAGDEIFIMQYIYAYEIMKQHNYKKVIILGCDTITTYRVDEFLDDNEHEVLASLNYPCVEQTEHWKSPILNVGQDPNGNIIRDVLNVNADVVCFNSSEALKTVIDLSIEHYGGFSIQGGLNEVVTKNLLKCKVVDFPYYSSKCVYNARSKGVYGTDMINKGMYHKHGYPLDGTPSPIRRWKVVDNKLFTEDDKQIKVWHYVEGLGGRPIEKFKSLIDDFKFTWFNEETINYLKNNCDCKEFFENEYKIK